MLQKENTNLDLCNEHFLLLISLSLCIMLLELKLKEKICSFLWMWGLNQTGYHLSPSAIFNSEGLSITAISTTLLVVWPMV